MTTQVDTSKRYNSLKEHFHAALKRAFNATDEQEFRKCFPGFEERQVAAFFECYRQVLFQVRSNSEAEFEVVYEEAQLASKFAAIDQLCEEQGLCDAPRTDGSVRHAVEPADIMQAQRVLAKQREVQELTAILAEARSRQELCGKEAEAKQAELLQRAQAFKPITGAATQVHEASTMWNERGSAVV